MGVRMLRLGGETGALARLGRRAAEFFEAKLQRSLDRVVGIAGPLAIVTISIFVGGLIVSVMTALLSVSQIVELKRVPCGEENSYDWLANSRPLGPPAVAPRRTRLHAGRNSGRHHHHRPDHGAGRPARDQLPGRSQGEGGENPD